VRPNINENDLHRGGNTHVLFALQAIILSFIAKLLSSVLLNKYIEQPFIYGGASNSHHVAKQK
jgi:hypothetical protein